MRYAFPVSIAFLWLTVFSLWIGCRQPSDAAAPPKPEEKPMIVGVSLTKAQAHLKNDIEAAAAKHPNLRLIFRKATDVNSQYINLNEFNTGGARVIIVSPIDSQAISEPVAKLYETGMPIIVLDKPVIGDKYTCYIAPDWEQIGAAAGIWLAEKLQGKGKIVEIKGPVDSIPADQLHDAFRGQLRDPGYRFVFEGFVDPSRVDAAKLMADAMADVDKFDAVFAFDDAAARAAYETAKTAGREKGVLFIGVGGVADSGKKLVEEGILSASVLVPNGAAEAVEAVVKLIAGEKVDKKIVPPTRVITP